MSAPERTRALRSELRAVSTTATRNTYATCQKPVEGDYRSWEEKVISAGAAPTGIGEGNPGFPEVGHSASGVSKQAQV